MINQRFCDIKGHEINPIILICTYTCCKRYSRWICVECNNQNIHDHKQINNNHIQDINQFKNQLINSTQKLFVEKVNKLDMMYLRYLHEIEDHILSCKKKVFQKNTYNQAIDQAFKMTQADIFSIDKDQLNLLIQFELEMVTDYIQFQNTLRFADVQIKNMISRIDSILNDQKAGIQNSIPNKLVNIQAQMDQYNCQKNYQQICKLFVQFDSFAARISPNEKYLVFCNENNKIQLNNILKSQKLGILSQSSKIELVEFSQNSQSIILCTNNGKIKVFNIGNWKLQYYKKFNKSSFINLLLIDDKQILTRQQDRSVIITHLGNRKQIQIIQFTHNKKIIGFDLYKLQQIIVIGFEDQIDLYNIQGLSLFSFNLPHSCKMDQLSMLQNDRLLITYDGSLLLLDLDFEANKILLLKQCRLIQKYYSLACNNSRIILIEKFKISILDNNLNKIQEVPHNNGSVFFVNKPFKQIESLNYILVQGGEILDIIELSDMK